MSSRKVVVIGGGVIGLSIGWQLARRDVEVTIIDKNRFGQKASWAGAGILSPANYHTMTHPLDRLMGLGSELHAKWAVQLRDSTGIDNGFRTCGGIYIARTAGERAALHGLKSHWQQYDVEFEEIRDREKLRPFNAHRWADQSIAISVPGESQICNPDHLKALIRACEMNGATMIENCGPLKLIRNQSKIAAVVIDDEPVAFDQICCCSGAWSTQLLNQLGVNLPVIPVRGQMLLYKLEQKLFDPIINEGSRYIVPRDDGHVLVGSTTEEVGFDESTTEDKMNELQEFATSVVSELTASCLVRTWAGLRPASHDGFPFMGRIAGIENGFVATGHFKAGIQMSSAVAELMADVMEGEQPELDLHAFNPARLNATRDFVLPADNRWGGS